MENDRATTAKSTSHVREYNSTLAKVSLADVYLTNVICEADLSKRCGQLTGNFDIHPDGYEIDKGYARIFAAMTFSGCNVENEDRVVDIKARYTVSLQSEEHLNDHFVSRFAASNLTLIVWPFCRELIHTMVTRMGLPPLVAPLMLPSSAATKNAPGPSSEAEVTNSES
jgi:hypothetical protein